MGIMKAWASGQIDCDDMKRGDNLTFLTLLNHTRKQARFPKLREACLPNIFREKDLVVAAGSGAYPLFPAVQILMGSCVEVRFPCAWSFLQSRIRRIPSADMALTTQTATDPRRICGNGGLKKRWKK